MQRVLLFKLKYRIGQPENYLFYYLKKSFLDQSIQKTCYVVLKTQALNTNSDRMSDTASIWTELGTQRMVHRL